MKFITALLLLIAACAAPQIGTPAPPHEEFASESERLNAWFEEVDREALLQRPMDMSRRGMRERQSEWDDISDEKARDDYQVTLRDLATLLNEFDYSALDEQTQLSYRLFQYRCESALERFPYRLHSYPVNQMFGAHSEVPSFLISIHTVETPQDAEAYVARLRRAGHYLDQAIRNLQVRAERGILAPSFVYPLVISDCQNLLRGAPFDESGVDSTILADLRSKVAGLSDLGDAARARLVEQGAEALRSVVGPAYRRLIATLEDLEERSTTDDGAWKLPDGSAFYAHALRRTTTTDLSAGKIHEIGLLEVNRIHDEMRAIQEQVGFDGTLQDFFVHLRDSPDFYYPNDDEGRAEYLARATELIDVMRTRLPELFGTLPRADIEVRRVEPYRERSAGKAFYQRGTPDGARPGIYYANLYDMRDMPIYQMEALAYHEGIPGHHMQGSIAQELEDLPTFRRFSGYTAYGEGWALYTEYLPREIGLYEDPYSDFGRLAMELWRACRLVVDTGIHHHRWTRERAIDYLLENTPNPEGDCVKAIERYIVMPGQATGYKIGMMKILELRERARAALGDAFDIRDFHDIVLRNGPVPLTILEELIDEWTP